MAWERASSSQGRMPAFTPRKHPGVVSAPPSHHQRPLPGLRGLGTDKRRSGCRGPHAFPCGVRLLMGLNFAWTRAGWLEAGRWRVYLDFSLSFAQMLLPCAAHPPASLGLRLSRNLSEKLSKKPQALRHRLPPRACARGLGGKLSARARVRVVRVRACALAVMGGRFGHNEGNRFFSPPPAFRRCASALGQLPSPLRDAGRGGPQAPVVSPRTCALGSSSPGGLFHGVCGSVFDVQCVGPSP